MRERERERERTSLGNIEREEDKSSAGVVKMKKRVWAEQRGRHDKRLCATGRKHRPIKHVLYTSWLPKNEKIAFKIRSISIENKLDFFFFFFGNEF